MTFKLQVLAIVGPTAVGKTALSLQLAHRLQGEIINGDSMQVYKGLDIGTAKIQQHEMEGIPHHLFDLKEPTESFSVAEYQQAVRTKIEEVLKRGKLPIIVGGTGLYIQSVLYDFRFTEQAANEEIRQRLEEELVKLGAEALYARLTELDPESAEKIHPNNHRRLIRALEIVEVTGKTKDEHENNKGTIPLYNHLIIGLDANRDWLYARINERVDLMVEQGLIEEARALWNKGIRNVQAVSAIGYKELYAYFDGQMSLDAALEWMKKNTRNYAKRQLTYFRNKLLIQWFDRKLCDEKIIEAICKKIKDLND